MTAVKNFWDNNWKWFSAIIFFAGLNIGIAQVQLSEKINIEEARVLISAEIKEKTMSKTDGAILRTKQDYIIITLDEIKELVKQ